MFTGWKEAVDFASNLLSDKAALDSLQEKIIRWWREYKFKLQNEVAEALGRL